MTPEAWELLGRLTTLIALCTFLVTCGAFVFSVVKFFRTINEKLDLLVTLHTSFLKNVEGLIKIK